MYKFKMRQRIKYRNTRGTVVNVIPKARLICAIMDNGARVIGGPKTFQPVYIKRA